MTKAEERIVFELLNVVFLEVALAALAEFLNPSFALKLLLFLYLPRGFTFDGPCNGTRRIIDYKTSQVSQSEMELVNWDDITNDYKAHSKSFQIMTYAYMLNAQTPFTTPVEAGIISFKNLKSGLLKFAKKDKPGSYAQKTTVLSSDLLVRYEYELKTLILELFNPC